MATYLDFTFTSYLFATDVAVNAFQATTATFVRDRFGNLIRVKPGEYILKDEDDKLRVMPASLFEAEYTAVGTITAPDTLSVANPTVAQVELTWNVGDAAATPHIEKGGVEIATNAPNDGTYTATGLSANTAYVFRVRNRKTERYSAYLTPLTVYTLPVPVAAAPTATAQTSTTITILWVNSDATAKTQIWVDDGLGGSFSKFSTEAAAATTKQITGLTSGRTYVIKLKHEGAVSALASATYSPTLSHATD